MQGALVVDRIVRAGVLLSLVAAAACDGDGLTDTERAFLLPARVGSAGAGIRYLIRTEPGAASVIPEIEKRLTANNAGRVFVERGRVREKRSNVAILADAKDADMAFGIGAPGQSPEAHTGEVRFRTLEEYREQIRQNTRQGLVDIMLMSASTNYQLALAMQSRYDEATLVDEEAGEAKALNNAGYAAMLKKEYNEAEKLFLKAIEVNPSFYRPAYENLQVLYHLRDGNS